MHMLEVMPHQVQLAVIRSSYCHKYGVFIRLSMFSGLRMEELLGLQWDDVDTNGVQLRIRYEQREDDDGFGPYDACFPRYVPLLPHALNDLMGWHEIQRKAIASMSPFFFGCPSVTLLPNGYQMDVKVLQDIYCEILQASKVRDYSFGALRDTFAARAVEQGLGLECLCNVLGDLMAAEKYKEFKGSRRDTDRALMETLLSTRHSSTLDVAFHVVVTPLENGLTQLFAPNFPDATCTGMDLTHGLLIMREKMMDLLQCYDYLPIPTPISNIPCKPNAYIIMIPIQYQ